MASCHLFYYIDKENAECQGNYFLGENCLFRPTGSNKVAFVVYFDNTISYNMEDKIYIELNLY